MQSISPTIFLSKKVIKNGKCSAYAIYMYKCIRLENKSTFSPLVYMTKRYSHFPNTYSNKFGTFLFDLQLNLIVTIVSNVKQSQSYWKKRRNYGKSGLSSHLYWLVMLSNSWALKTNYIIWTNALHLLHSKWKRSFGFIKNRKMLYALCSAV